MIDLTLKPCPFCGSEDLTRCVGGGYLPSFIDPEKENEILSKTPYAITCTLECDDCGARVEGYAASDKALDSTLYDRAINNCFKKWNRRNGI